MSSCPLFAALDQQTIKQNKEAVSKAPEIATMFKNSLGEFFLICQ